MNGAHYRGPGAWLLTSEGAVVHPNERTAVIADVHLGYEWARGSDGDCVPAHSLAETLAKLDALLSRIAIERLIVAGDLLEAPRPCRRTLADLKALARWLADRHVELIPLQGNHDPAKAYAKAATHEIDDWTIGHGHRPIASPRTITGHLHPVLRFEGTTASCFLVGPRTIILPPFSANAAGWNVASGPLAAERQSRSLRCVAVSGEEWFDFGPVGTLANRLRRS